MPGESAWWVVFLGVAVLGLWVTWRTAAKASAVLAAATAVWVIAFYTFLVPFGAPRYILPSLALMSILAADAVAWLVTQAPWRTTAVAFACVFLLSGVVSQRYVLQREVATEGQGRQFQAKAAELRSLGVRPPCAIYSPSVAYYVGCTAPWTGGTMHEVLSLTPQGADGWRKEKLPNGSTVYVPR